MKKVYVGDCPVCGQMRVLTERGEGRWESVGDELVFITERVILTAVCPEHLSEDPGRRWTIDAGESWVITGKVEEDTTGEEDAHAAAGADGV